MYPVAIFISSARWPRTLGLCMTRGLGWLRAPTVAFLFLLVAGEVVIATKLPDPVSVALTFALITTAPIFMLIAAVLKSSRLAVALTCAWVSIAVGTTIQGAYHSSYDPSKVLILPISIATYWLCGFVTLFSFGTKQP